jgi:sulfite reductase (NADPH) flavoprotein alpha-component
MALDGLFTAWVRYVYLVVTMENALANDYGFAGTAATLGPPADELTPFKLQFLVEAHRRFLSSYLDGLIGDDLTDLWQLTVGFCAPDQDVRALAERLADIRDDPGHRLARDSVAHVRSLLTGDLTDADRSRIAGLAGGYAEADRAVLRSLKGALRDGILAFEQYEGTVVERAGERLLDAIRTALTVVTGYYQRLAELTEAHGITRASLPTGLVEAPIPADRGIPGHGTPPDHRP